MFEGPAFRASGRIAGMETLKQIIPLLLTVSLGLIVVAAGLGSARGDFVYVLRNGRLLSRSVLAICILPLLFALAVVAIFPLPRPAMAGILLMGLSPVPPLMMGKALKFGGTRAYVYGLQAAAAVMALFSVPLLGTLVAHFYEIEAQFPFVVVAKNVFVGILVPLAIGLALGRWIMPEFAPRLVPVVMIIAWILLIAAFVPIVIGAWPQITALIGDGTVLVMAIFIGLSVASGHFLGDPASPSSLGFAAGMRHPGIALALASANESDKSVSAAVLLVLLTGLIVLIPYQFYLKRSATAKAAIARAGDADAAT
jgi:BASS family bile acid:Na+ symporter